MYIVWSLALIVCGVLAASTLIISKKPNAKELIDKLVPVQGWIGLVVCIVGLWAVINCLMNISIMHLVPLRWTVALAMGVLMTLLGFLLGFGLISQFTMKGNPEAAAKGEALRMKLTKFQVPLGLAGIGLGIVGLILNFV
jgi:hypothetical protein